MEVLDCTLVADVGDVGGQLLFGTAHHTAQ